MSDYSSKIQARINAFVADLQQLLQQETLDRITSALKGRPVVSSPAAISAPKRRGRPPKNATPEREAPKAKGGRKKRGDKRTSDAIEAMSEKILAYVKSNPGQGVEAIGRGMNTPTKDLNLPIRKMLEDGRLKRKGEKRATKYFPK